MYTVALVGHSNLPVFPSYEDVRVEIFKSKGALLTDIWDPLRFEQRMLQQRWDCVILFLGGNDLADCHNPKIVFERFTKVLKAFEHVPKVFVTDVEPRNYTPEKERRFKITNKQYRDLRDMVNNRLKRYAKSTRSFQLVHVPPGYQKDSHDQGIHLGLRGERELIGKYKNKIRDHREKTGR